MTALVTLASKLQLPQLLGLILLFGLSVMYLQARVSPGPQVMLQKNIYAATWNVKYSPTRFHRVSRTKQVSPKKPAPKADRPAIDSLHELPAHNVSVFSAIGRNSSRNSGWETIILNAWEGKNHVNDTYDCCIHYDNGAVIQLSVAEKNHWLKCKRVHYIAVQMTCSNVLRGNHTKPIGVTLIQSNSTCSVSERARVPVHLPRKESDNTTAICAKIAYGSISPKRLIEWYEVQRHMGVAKIVTYTYNLSLEARRVLEHYERTGIVDLIPYRYPHTREVPRAVGDKKGQVFNDEQVAAFDCIERLAGFHFVGLIDHDEFLVPTPDAITRWKQLFTRFHLDAELASAMFQKFLDKRQEAAVYITVLLKKKPNASGFSFRTELFVLDWKEGKNSSAVGSIASFTNRTRPMWDRRKNIFLPERVVPGSIWTHNYTDAIGYEKFLVQSGFATVKHFRSCRKEWLKTKSCFRRRRYQDLHVTRLVETVKARIQRVERQLLT